MDLFEQLLNTIPEYRLYFYTDDIPQINVVPKQITMLLHSSFIQHGTLSALNEKALLPHTWGMVIHKDMWATVLSISKNYPTKEEFGEFHDDVILAYDVLMSRKIDRNIALNHGGYIVRDKPMQLECQCEFCKLPFKQPNSFGQSKEEILAQVYMLT